jgi:methyl-accepting chemotaxis protein
MMKFLRKTLGVFVMIAGVIGLLLSLTGLVGIWVAKPVLTTSINSTIDTLIDSVDTSQQTLEITYDALGATVNSIDALASMLDTTVLTVEDTQPAIDKVNIMMAEQLPDTIETATDSLTAAESAAASLESAIKSFEVLQAILGSTPFLSAVIPPAAEPYNPETSLADSLKELSASIEDMPDTFIDMSKDLDKVDENLLLVTDSMSMMSENVTLISQSLSQYQTMISESKSSTDSLSTMLTTFKNGMDKTINIASIVLLLFFLWLLATQVVIFSQGYELYHGTASAMAASQPEEEVTEMEAPSSEIEVEEVPETYTDEPEDKE